ncbi:uncharacterized protein LOC110855673 [Folsomia candida]|uniref:uncharacterized protein LOC110855673 n=1 Tax=Folsomia candida TaxID=158441 RepID=UPI000B901ACC|nr:uncharacterized protein LOC110855673 [Folsomia candida]
MHIASYLFLLLLSTPLLIAGANEYYNFTRDQRSLIGYVWEGGIIPYEFKPDFPSRDRAMFVQTARFIEQRTCIQFREKLASDRFWLILVLGGCCGTHGGRRPELEGKGQEATFSSGLPMPFYLHELGHTFGFPHEQDRPDWPEYAWWDDNKQDTCKGGEGGKAKVEQAALDIPFDYVSLMADWTECWWPKPPTPKNIPLGGGGSDDRTYSVLDIERINAVHGCGKCYGYRFRKITQLSYNQRPVQAGYELDKKIFYICRVYHEGHLLIGKSRPDDDKCWVGWDNGETEYKERFSVLTNPGNEANFRWIRSTGSIPSGAIKGGRTKDRETIYVGRCKINVDNRDTLIPGFYLESKPGELRVPFGGGVRRCNDFEALVCQ